MPLLRKVMVPVGPKPLLCVATVAVRITFSPVEADDGALMPVAVAA